MADEMNDETLKETDWRSIAGKSVLDVFDWDFIKEAINAWPSEVMCADQFREMRRESAAEYIALIDSTLQAYQDAKEKGPAPSGLATELFQGLSVIQTYAEEHDLRQVADEANRLRCRYMKEHGGNPAPAPSGLESAARELIDAFTEAGQHLNDGVTGELQPGRALVFAPGFEETSTNNRAMKAFTALQSLTDALEGS